MPVKNIIPGQKVTQEKLQRAKELRHEMTPAETILWQELRANITFEGSKSSQASLSIFIVTRRHWSSKSMGIFTIYKKKKI